MEKTLAEYTEHKVGERELGTDPASGQPVLVKIGRYGPMVQIGLSNKGEKPRFATLAPGLSISTVTLEEALDLFKLPRTVGEADGHPIIVNSGRFGPYVQHDRTFASIPKGEDPLSITLERAQELLDGKRRSEAARHIKSFGEDEDMKVLNGRFGPYISYKKKNFKLPNELAEKAAELTYEECKRIVESGNAKAGKSAARKKRK